MSSKKVQFKVIRALMTPRAVLRQKSCADPEGETGGPDPPVKLQKYRFS